MTTTTLLCRATRRGRWTYGEHPGLNPGWRLDGTNLVLDYDPRSWECSQRGAWTLWRNGFEQDAVSHYLADAMAHVDAGPARSLRITSDRWNPSRLRQETFTNMDTMPDQVMCRAIWLLAEWCPRSIGFLVDAGKAAASLLLRPQSDPNTAGDDLVHAVAARAVQHLGFGAAVADGTVRLLADGIEASTVRWVTTLLAEHRDASGWLVDLLVDLADKSLAETAHLAPGSEYAEAARTVIAADQIEPFTVGQAEVLRGLLVDGTTVEHAITGARLL
jgi:hypothetical protein